MLDIEKLCAAVNPEQPTGSDLEYDPAFLALEQVARGKEGLYNPVSQQIEGGEEPEWPRVRELAVELFGRTKDLRVAVHLCGALLKIDGLPGLAEGLALIARLLELYWSNVYPPLVAEENNDPVDRINALENLASAEGLLRQLREATLVEARGLGRFSLRDLDLVEGRANPREKESVPTLALLQGAWNEGDPEANAARAMAVGALQDQLKHIQAIFAELAGSAPDL
ncbi:MAG: type VI secretion system ImpA family N-terminal domain-containing protein, partial [Thiobacillaceae bacterium]|nr:type VI secretion system ImpA family N-terminal domain-containing protein [Thiobacillaceae bacterium]